MSKKPDLALTCLGAIVVGVGLMIWSAGTFVRAFGDPGPSIPATVLSRHVNRGQGSVVVEYTPPGGSRTSTQVGVPADVATSYREGQSTQVFLRSFLGSARVDPAESLAAERRDEAIFSAIPLFGGLIAALAAALVLLLRRKTLFRV